jgi:hypothetical protein
VNALYFDLLIHVQVSSLRADSLTENFMVFLSPLRVDVGIVP